MRHPFDGVQDRKETSGGLAAPTRRGALAALGALLAGLFGWRAVAQAAVAPPRQKPRLTEALHEDGRPSTAAAFEEGGRPPFLTEKLGEDGHRPTSLAIGEEGGRPTTQAVGEEGGRPPRLTQALHEDGRHLHL